MAALRIGYNGTEQMSNSRITVVDNFRGKDNVTGESNVYESRPQETPRLQGVRIIIAIGILEMGGSERQALAVARYLQDSAGADVEVWGCTGGRGPVAELC